MRSLAAIAAAVVVGLGASTAIAAADTPPATSAHVSAPQRTASSTTADPTTTAAPTTTVVTSPTAVSPTTLAAPTPVRSSAHSAVSAATPPPTDEQPVTPPITVAKPNPADNGGVLIDDGGWCVAVSSSDYNTSQGPVIPASDCGPDGRYYPGGYNPATAAPSPVCMTNPAPPCINGQPVYGTAPSTTVASGS